MVQVCNLPRDFKSRSAGLPSFSHQPWDHLRTMWGRRFRLPRARQRSSTDPATPERRPITTRLAWVRMGHARYRGATVHHQEGGLSVQQACLLMEFGYPGWADPRSAAASQADRPDQGHTERQDGSRWPNGLSGLTLTYRRDDLKNGNALCSLRLCIALFTNTLAPDRLRKPPLTLASIRRAPSYSLPPRTCPKPPTILQ